MKLLLVLILGFLAVFQVSGTSLKDAVGMPEAAELDVVQNDVVDLFTKAIKQIILSILEKILEAKNTISEKLKVSLKEVLDILIQHKAYLSGKLKDILEKIKEHVKLSNVTSSILNKLLGNKYKRSLIDDDFPREIEEAAIREITSSSSLKKLRAYVKNLAAKSKHEVIRAVHEVMKRLTDRELKLLISEILSGKKHHGSKMVKRQISDLLQKIRDLIQAFGAKALEKFQPLIEWVIERWNGIKAKLQEHISLVKAVAEELIGHSKTISKIVAEEALKLLSGYKKSLGAVYEPLMKKLREIILGNTDTTTVAPIFF